MAQRSKDAGEQPRGSIPPRATESVTVEFRMAAEHLDASSVHLAGEFNDWSRTATPMSPIRSAPRASW